MKPARDEGGDGLQDVDAQLQQLLDAYGAFLRAAVRRFCPSSLGVAADEVEQDARVRLWHALQRERNITDPASYLYKVAATAAIDAARRVRARRETSIDASVGPGLPSVVENLRDASRSPEQLAGDRELRSRIDGALQRLPDNRRRAVGLHLQGFTSVEIGAMLGWTEPKARNLTHRGLKDLRELLRSEGIDLPESTL